jgi:thiol-disulfide isomerase/thioredoxin
MRVLIIALCMTLCLECTVALAQTLPSTQPYPASLNGTWLVESCTTWQSVINRSTLKITDGHFAFHGFRNLDTDWTGTITIGADGDAHHFDMQTDPFSLAGIGSSFVYPAARALPGIFNLAGDRLQICFACEDHGARPEISEAGDGKILATFVRADAGFKSFPPSVLVTALDPKGQPAPGATLFGGMSFARQRKNNADGKAVPDVDAPMMWKYADRGTVGKDGTLRLTYDEFCGQSRVPIGARDPTRHWIGLANVSPAILSHGELTIHLQPQRLIRGTIQAGLSPAGDAPWTAAFLTAFDNRFAFCITSSGKFEFPVPPGTYSLYAYGTNLIPRNLTVVVPEGDGDQLILPISLRSSRLASLIGKPAPPLVKVVAWKNGPPVNLADLKGKLVLLNFWGYWCGPCVAEMPTLMHLHEKYQSRGLEVVGVHVDAGDDIDTVDKLDAKTQPFRQGIWKNRDVPYPVALCFKETDGKFGTDDLYGVQGFPTTIIIDRNGLVVGDTVGIHGIDLTDLSAADSAIEKLLAGN